MITAPKATRKINKFVEVAIPSARDLFRRYGERDSSGMYLTSSDEVSDVTSCSPVPIAQMVQAQNLLASQTDKH